METEKAEASLLDRERLHLQSFEVYAGSLRSLVVVPGNTQSFCAEGPVPGAPENQKENVLRKESHSLLRAWRSQIRILDKSHLECGLISLYR